jgi:hypothetical protein
MAAQALAKTYTDRPRLTSTDRLIERSQNETRYVPAGMVPDEIHVTLYLNHIDFVFTYPVQETPSSLEKTNSPFVHVVVGKYTEKILNINTEFAERDFSSLLVRLQETEIAIKNLKGRAQKEVAQKSYDIITRLIKRSTEKIVEERAAIIECFTTKSAE